MKNVNIRWLRILPMAGIFFTSMLYAQSKEYLEKKNEKLKAASPFEPIISGNEQNKLIYQDEFVVAFVPLRKQAPVHLLIVPKKRITSVNEIEENDVLLMGRLMLAAKILAKQFEIEETGYRLAINTNEDAGQSVFHLHMHLLGGMPLGPMLPQSYKE